jgi:hypothetical protein
VVEAVPQEKTAFNNPGGPIGWLFARRCSHERTLDMVFRPATMVVQSPVGAREGLRAGDLVVGEAGRAAEKVGIEAGYAPNNTSSPEDANPRPRLVEKWVATRWNRKRKSPEPLVVRTECIGRQMDGRVSPVELVHHKQPYRRNIDSWVVRLAGLVRVSPERVSGPTTRGRLWNHLRFVCT